ncbi:RYamide receptor-like [Oculina patagonica]
MPANLNTTINGTQPTSCYADIEAAKIGYTLVYCLILVVSLLGNSLIGITVYKTKTMRKPINFLIVNMAMSDLLWPIFVIPSTIQFFYINSWLISGPLGQALCKLAPFFQDVSGVVSIQSLVLIAVDRFGAVVFPLHSPLISSKLCPFFILATWIVAMANGFPFLVAYKLVEYPGGLKCELQWKEVFGESSSSSSYTLAVYVTFFYTPWVLITALYTIILLKLKSQKTPGNQSVSGEQQRVKRERNVLKLAIAIVSCFAVCWLPSSILVLLDIFAWDYNTRLPCSVILYYRIALAMAHSNCALNPCICFIFSRNYRQGTKSLFRAGVGTHRSFSLPKDSGSPKKSKKNKMDRNQGRRQNLGIDEARSC